MADRVLVPSDGSPLSTRALEHVVERFPDATITAIHVIDPVNAIYVAEDEGPVVAEDWYERAKDHSTSILDELTAAAADRGVEIEVATAVGNPAREIVDYADEHDIDQIVMGSHGRTGLSRMFLGSVAERVLRRASCPVTIIR